MYDIIDDMASRIGILEAENTELRATLSKMETVEKELRERLEKADRRAEVAEQKATAWKDCANKWQKYYKEQAEREIKRR